MGKMVCARGFNLCFLYDIGTFPHVFLWPFVFSPSMKCLCPSQRNFCSLIPMYSLCFPILFPVRWNHVNGSGWWDMRGTKAFKGWCITPELRFLPMQWPWRLMWRSWNHEVRTAWITESLHKGQLPARVVWPATGNLRTRNKPLEKYRDL